jgi:hypothetical protein
MFVTICDACGADTSKGMTESSFDFAKWKTARVCKACTPRFYASVGAVLDDIRAERNVAPEHMPTQQVVYDRWRAIRPLMRVLGKTA